MSKYLIGGLDGSSQQVLVPDSNPKIKNPKISVYDQLNVDTFSTNYDIDSVNRAVSDAII